MTSSPIWKLASQPSAASNAPIPHALTKTLLPSPFLIVCAKNRRPEISGRRFCFCVFVFLQSAFQPVTNVGKDLFAVQLHQQLMPGAGVQLDLDILHTGIQQALDRPLHTCALFAHRVGIACQEQQGQIAWAPGPEEPGRTAAGCR